MTGTEEEKVPSTYTTVASSREDNLEQGQEEMAATEQGDGLKYDGGWKAWSTVFGSFLVQFCIIGLPMSFGVTARFYASDYLRDYTPSQINWIGSVQLCLMFVMGLSVAQLFDAGYFHYVSIAGSSLVVFSMFMLSLAHPGSYYQIFLSQGIGTGLGIGITYTSTSSVVAHHFRRKRGLAMGIIISGGAIGGFFFSLVLGRFLDTEGEGGGRGIGFAWGIRIVAFVTLGCMVVGNLLMRTNYPPKSSSLPSPTPTPPRDSPAEKVTANVDPLAPTPRRSPKQRPQFLSNLSPYLHSPPFVLMLVFGFTISLSLYNPMFSVELFASSYPSIPPSLSRYLLAILNLTSALGRTLPAALADRLGMFEVYIPCMVCCGIVALVMPACTSPGGIVVFCVLYGFFSGSVASLFYPATLSLSKNLSGSGIRLGLVSVPVGIAALVGTPIAAALTGSASESASGGNRGGKWWAGAVFTGVVEVFAGLLLVAVYVLKRREAAKEKA